MTPQEFQQVYPPLIGWIQSTLATHKSDAVTVASLNFARLPHYYSPAVLSAAKVVRVPKVPVPPLSSIGLSRFAAFEHMDMDGITYLDTFFIKQSQATNEVLHFHELVHVVQWHLFGPQQFLASYADGLEKFGYENSPLEQMAYALQTLFSQGQAFDAEKVIRAKLSL